MAAATPAGKGQQTAREATVCEEPIRWDKPLTDSRCHSHKILHAVMPSHDLLWPWVNVKWAA